MPEFLWSCVPCWLTGFLACVAGALLGTGFLFLKLMGLRFTVFVGGLVLLEQGWNRTLHLMRA